MKKYFVCLINYKFKKVLKILRADPNKFVKHLFLRIYVQAYQFGITKDEC